MSKIRCLMCVSAVLLSAIVATAQINPNEDQGLKPYDTWHGGDLDSVSVTNGSLSLHIPLASFPQRGNLDLSFMVSFSNKQWYVKPEKCCDAQGHITSPAQWLPMPNTGMQIVSSTDWWLNSCGQAEPSDPNNPGGMTLYDWSDSVSSPDGSAHMFGDQIADASQEMFPVRSLDASGLMRPDAQTVILPNGSRYSYTSASGCALPTGRIRGGAQPTSVTDANGNLISISTTGWTDTMGRFIPGSASTAVRGIQPGVPTSDLSQCPVGASSALIWNVPGVGGAVRTFYFCYSMFSLSTNFPNPSSATGLNYGPVNTSLLSAVVLPDMTKWTFTYDNYGDVQRVGFPTGGSLAYTYVIGPINSNTGTGFSTWIQTRTVDANDGTGGHQWTYNYQGPTGSYSIEGVATVTSPDGNDVVHTIGPGNAPGCPGYVYQTQYFQGHAGSAPLKTVQMQYDCTMGLAGGDLDGIALNVVPKQVITSFPSGQTAKVVNAYDPLFNDPQAQPVRVGSLLQKDEYDFSNVLARSTLTRYLWQDNANYLTNNFVSLPEWSTVYNGSAPASTTLPACSSSSTPACISQSKYAYDEGTRASSGIGAPTHLSPPAGDAIRGNMTTASRWLDTAGAFVSGTSAYFDTGMKASSTDALNRVTSYTYSSTFQGAYLTKTNLPDTIMPDQGAAVVHHVISGNYDFNTGLLTSFTDENSQIYSYAYDNMLRLTEGDHPDFGVTKFFYPDPNTVERQRLISGTAFDDFKVKFDGIGRPYQNQQLTPDCAGYIKVDTTYDVLGRTNTVSNPYCLTSETTYGITQNQYDALSRSIKSTKQDQSVTSVVYNDVPGDSSGPSAICTTATDESGKKRQSCTDAFGRLIKVIEPNPGAAATAAAGWVAVSGNEQSANSQPATPASVTVMIGGTDSSNSLTTCTTTCRVSSPKDTGSLQFSVNAGGTILTSSVTYGGSSTQSGLADSLAGSFPANSLVQVIHTAGSTVITLQAISPGAAGNAFTISTSMATNCVDSDTLTCAGVGWTMTLSGPNLAPTAASSASFSGGQNASSTADTGNISVTINGTPYSTGFGAGDSSGTIAGRLASLISAGNWANASPAGGTINLTSKVAGTVGDYTISTAYTWNSTQFVSPSFTTSSSGAALGNAKDVAGLNNNPLVTTYQYNARGDMLCVHQKATDTSPDVACTGTTPPVVPAAWRQRFFTYDSFSRILTAMNPETNSTGSTVIRYSYDPVGNLASKTEPAPNAIWTSGATVTVNYTYDALNRLLDTTHSDGTTQNSSHRYDYSSFWGVALKFPIGREVAATAANGTIGYLMSYDPMGRVATTTQCNPGVSGCKTFSALYDKLGDLTSLAYPSNNFTVTYGYDSAARLTTATDSAGVIYAQTPTYWANGSMKEFTSPNFANNKYHVDLNNRLQPTEIWAGTAEGASALFDKKYIYGAATANNGNISTITNVLDSTRTQSFGYDALNRLLSAGDNGHWANTYVYDAWGNLTNKNVGNPAGENLQKAADPNNHLSGMSYDAGGNVTNDGLSHTFTYDAENRITSTSGVTYTYDADGRRIAKSTGINYWFAPDGGVLAETDSSGVWTNYIDFDGQRLARSVNGDIKYYITDHLHSTGMFVDKAGTTAAIQDDNDFYPWGGVVPGVGKTTSTNTIKFTGQYRDSESQLDYFGARYYSNINGRFMSPDWAGSPTTVPYAKFGDPQSLNLYAYVENGPINRVDADGHDFVNESFQDWGMDLFGSGAFGTNKGNEKDNYKRLQQLEVSTSSAMATEQGNVSLTPQFTYAINSWIYRMNQKIDGVLSPGYKALENIISLENDLSNKLSTPIFDGPVIAADPFVNPSGVPVPLRIIHNEPPLQQSASYAEWSKKSTEEIIRSLARGSETSLQVAEDGAIMNGNTRITILMERGVNVNALPRTLYVPDMVEFPDLKIPE